MSQASAVDEVIVGDYVLRLDGTVFEILHTSGSGHRIHVNHVKAEGTEKGRDLKLNIGIEAVKGVITNGAKLRVPEAQVSSVLALLERAKQARTAAM